MGQTRDLCILVLGTLAVAGCSATVPLGGHEAMSPPVPCAECLVGAPRVDEAAPAAAKLPAPPTLQADDRPLPINLPTALQLANVRALDVAAAAQRIQVAAAVLDQASVQWLPTVTMGGDYARHAGRIQGP